MNDRPRSTSGPVPGAGGAPRGAPMREESAALAAAWLDLWDRNQSELARRGMAALGARASAVSRAAAEARRRAEAEAARDAATSAPEPQAAGTAADPFLDTARRAETLRRAALAAAAVPTPPEARGEADAPARDFPADPAPEGLAAQIRRRLSPHAAPHRIGRPSPLGFHLSAAAASTAQAAAMSPLGDDPRFPWTETMVARGEALSAELRAAAGDRAPMIVARVALGQLSDMVAGIETWQAHPWRRPLEDPPTVWRRGSTRMLDYGATHEAGRMGRPVLVAPSLVNRPHVLDLHPDRSLLRFLASQGLRPLLLDWGQPGAEERDFDLSDYVRLRLAPAVEAARMLSPDGSAPAMLGYCMGGALAAALAAGGRDRISRLAVIGAPWDFEKLQGAGAAMLSLMRVEDRGMIRGRMEAVASAFGAIPVDALQLVFAALDPTLALRKFRLFRLMDQAGPRAEMFAATEDWLNDGVALAGPAARELLFDWFLDNATGRGVWSPEGAPARPAALRVPLLAFCSKNDRISPSACAEALPAAARGATILRPSTGHVGMITGSGARAQVWEPLAAFLAAR